jgi:release factor glutamine methyltransferase
LFFAKRNSKSLNVNNINFIKSNVFSNVQGKFDVIISNPPYIDIADYDSLDPCVKMQPKEALIADNKGYWFYQEIIRKSKVFLKENFLVIFEIGYKQEDEIIKIVLTYFSDIKVKKFSDNSFRVRVIAFYR